MLRHTALLIAFSLGFVSSSGFAAARANAEVTRVFIFAGQSNMEGADSDVEDIRFFPPFVGLEKTQKRVRFSYVLGREADKSSEGWVNLQPVDGLVGPELSFARKVAGRIDAPIAIIKCSAGGTHLGGDWNPDEPSGFEMYPRALELIRSSLAALDRKRVEYRIEGFMWHQGENDMFDEGYMAHYGENLRNFIAKVRRDLETPALRFYIGELCTKTIWGMDLRPRMYAISQGQKAVAEQDPLAEYVPTSHVGVEIGGGVGLHYHYGTLGQLEHGVNYADAYLRNIDAADEPRSALPEWPYDEGSEVRLFVLAGHRNMEGERAFVQELKGSRGGRAWLKDDHEVAFKYHLGGGAKRSTGWEPLGPAGLYDTFGPELSFAAALREKVDGPIAIAKFTDSGSQIIDWTPEGSAAESRHVYPAFCAFVKEAVAELTEKGHSVKVAGVFYHVGENDMSFFPFRKEAAGRIASIVRQSREDLAMPTLRWFVSQQPPTDHEDVNRIDVTKEIAALAAGDDRLVHIEAFDFPEQREQLVLDTEGVVWLGRRIAREYLAQKQSE